MVVRLNPYLAMNGNAREAVTFYKKAFDAEVVSVQTFGEMPTDPGHTIPDNAKELILHALLKVGETDLMLSDTFPGLPHQSGNQVTIGLQSDDINWNKRVFAALAEEGHVTMPMQQTFWSQAFGQVTDKFGVPWQISTMSGDKDK